MKNTSEVRNILPVTAKSDQILTCSRSVEAAARAALLDLSFGSNVSRPDSKIGKGGKGEKGGKGGKSKGSHEVFTLENSDDEGEDGSGAWDTNRRRQQRCCQY